MLGELLKKIEEDANLIKSKPKYQLPNFTPSKNNQMSKTKNQKPLGAFIQNGEVGDTFFTDQKSNHVHALCKYYSRVATCVPIKGIKDDKVVNLLEVTLIG